MSDALLETLLARPDLPQLTQHLTETLEQEHKARMQFRDDLTPEMKAEFIGGETIVHSPARHQHILVTGRLFTLLSTYVSKQKSGQVLMEKALVTLTRNDYEPDISFFASEKSTHFTDDQMEFPAPDLVVEVLSHSTEARDRGVKFQDYAQHGIHEYWIIDCEQQSIEQYLLPEDVSAGEPASYYLAQKLTQGEITSRVITNFTIPVLAIFDNEQQMAALQKILTETP